MAATTSPISFSPGTDTFLANPASLWNFRHITPSMQRYLQQVYLIVLGGILSVIAGTTLAIKMQMFSGWIGLLSFIPLIMLAVDSDKRVTAKRLGLFVSMGALQGMMIAPLVAVAQEIDPSIIVTAAVGTVAVFLVFSVAALVARRREYLFLGGALGSICSLLFFAGILNIFFRSSILFNIQLYLGLAMFIGYVVFDTQMIIERAATSVDVNGKGGDPVGDALALLIDLVGIFVRILIILLKNSKKDKK